MSVRCPPACSKRALAATSKAWHAAAWAAEEAAGGGLHLSLCRVSEGAKGAAKLQSLLDFLVRRRPRVARLLLSLAPGFQRGGEERAPGDRERLRCLACAVLALPSDQRFKLVLHSHMGADWMPRLSRVADADLDLDESDTDRECRRTALGQVTCRRAWHARR